MKVSYEDLIGAFRVNRPWRLRVLDGMDRLQQMDYLHLVDKKWTEVDHIDSDAVFMLNHRAFRYHFPCFIRLSQDNPAEYDPHVSSIVSDLSQIRDLRIGLDQDIDRIARQLKDIGNMDLRYQGPDPDESPAILTEIPEYYTKRGYISMNMKDDIVLDDELLERYGSAQDYILHLIDEYVHNHELFVKTRNGEYHRIRDSALKEITRLTWLIDSDKDEWIGKRYDPFKKRQFRIIKKWLHWLKSIEWDVESYADFEFNELDEAIIRVTSRC